MSLAGKTLFITGASRGIGLAIALRAARNGANIAIAAKTEAPHPKLPGTIHTAAAEIEAAGGRALALAVDVREETAVATAIERIEEACDSFEVDWKESSPRGNPTHWILRRASDDGVTGLFRIPRTEPGERDASSARRDDRAYPQGM